MHDMGFISYLQSCLAARADSMASHLNGSRSSHAPHSAWTSASLLPWPPSIAAATASRFNACSSQQRVS